MAISESYPMTGSCFLTVIALILFSLANHGAESHSAREVVQKYCYDCHDGETKKGELNLEALEGRDFARDTEVWEKVVRKMNARQMPPIGKRRPDEQTYKSTIEHLASDLDRAAEKAPNPGRTETL